MSAQQSDLSRFGYDVVVATTQDAINATMKEYLANVSAPEAIVAYVADDNNHAILADYQKLVAAVGSDLFAIPDGTASDDPRLQTLSNACGFMFAFKARIGLPAGLTMYPDIVTLNQGTEAVLYDMYFAEFEIVNLSYGPRGKIAWSNLSQPPREPWTFEFVVQTVMRTGDENAFDTLPDPIKRQIKNLDPDMAFSVQQLHLDLNTAALASTTPAIPGLPTSSAAWQFLAQDFIGTYWTALRASGDPILGISVKPRDAPRPSTIVYPSGTIIPTDLSIEVSPYRDAHGDKTGNYPLYTLDYLVLADNRVLPPAIPFTWNWLDADQSADAHGAIGVRRDVFVTFLRQLMEPAAAELCFSTYVSMTHDGEDFDVEYSYKLAPPGSAVFKLPASYTPDASGFLNVLQFSYTSNASDVSTQSSHFATIYGNFNYALTSTVAFKDNVVRLVTQGVAFFHFSEVDVGIEKGYLTGNFVNLTTTVDYQVAVTDQGALVVTQGTPVLNDTPDDMDITWWDRLNFPGAVEVMEQMQDSARTAISSAMTGFDTEILEMLNSAHGWVFPGGRTFTFKNSAFSATGDLVSYIAYADPGRPTRLTRLARPASLPKAADGYIARSHDVIGPSADGTLQPVPPVTAQAHSATRAQAPAGAGPLPPAPAPAPGPAPAASGQRLVTYSSELMGNFRQSETAAPDAAFSALQSDGGYSLLFSEGTDGAFYVTQELAGHVTGWARTDLSSALAANYGGAPVSTRAFAVAQNRTTGGIDVALAVTAAGGDELYLALGNSSSDTSWLAAPQWIRYPFDDSAHPMSKVVIADVFASQAADGEFIVVDILRDPDDAAPMILRYYIDPARKLTGQAWNPHDVSADLDAAKVTSCLGRRTGDRIDGIYTLGNIVGRPQLIFQPLYNVFNPAIPANPARLTPPGSALSAMAAVPVDGDATALFVTSDQMLYYFPPDAQFDGAEAVALITTPLLEDVTRLFAFATAESMIVWGLNRAQQVFYASCPRSAVTTASAWSTPLPIVSSAEQISPCVNRADDANTFFVHKGANEMQR
jgi:hypothetical protein